MAQTELELIRDGAVVRVIRVGDDPVRIGRDLANSVVLLDEDVSAHHAVVSRVAGNLTIRDLRSTNGTFVNGVRIGEMRALQDGDEVMLGSTALFRVRHVAPMEAARPVLEDLTAGTMHAIDDERFAIGSGADCHLRLAQGPARLATLTVHPDGEIWLGTADGSSRALVVGEIFELEGHRFRLKQIPVGRNITLRSMAPLRYPYALTATLEGPGGAVATLRHLTEGHHTYSVTTENRATLLYVLAVRLRDDRAAGKLDEEAGWCDDEDVLVAVWGRAALRQASSNYSVLLHRLRKELEEAGFDPWFIEKRRGAIRLRLPEVEVT